MKNLDEVLEMLEKRTLQKELKEWAKKKEDDACNSIHFHGGMALRNELGLWGKNELTKWFNSMGIFHADDMSGIIFTSLYRKLNNKDRDIDGQIKIYQDHWKKMGYKDGIPK